MSLRMVELLCMTCLNVWNVSLWSQAALAAEFFGDDEDW